ncbi:MAG TPA: 6-phosphogluconolactonase [Rhizomicrobium sp.]|jgi:6-phosphogluconolactonase
MKNAASVGHPGPSFHEFRSVDALYNDAAQAIAKRLTAAATRDGRASFVAPGGTTPGAMFDILARCQAPWKNIEITLSDDRWIETTSNRSNEKLVRARLLTASAAAARLIPFKTAHSRADEAENDVNAAIVAMHRPFDVVALGMGTDGHIASLIPGAAGLARALDRNDRALVRAIKPPDLAAMGERMTLTLRAILDARWIVLLIRGEEKLAAYRHALDGADPLEAPVRAVLHQQDVPVSVFWSA